VIRVPSSARAKAARSASVKTVLCRQAATMFRRSAVSPAAAASLVWMSTHQPQPLIWLIRRETKSRSDFGSEAFSMTWDVA
jgi:hypothetical protein